MVSASEVLKVWKSVRAFPDRPVEREHLEELVRLAARAPSSGNLQPWHARIIDGMSSCAQADWAMYDETVRDALGIGGRPDVGLWRSHWLFRSCPT